MRICVLFVLIVLVSCKNKEQSAVASINSLDLKRGELVSCGPQDGEMFGTVSFTASIPSNLQKDFNTGIALLHSFEYDEAEKVFAKIIDKAPDCAMAYWGVAMSNFHPLWFPPTPAELKKGSEAVTIANSIHNKTNREAAYIEAIGKFYDHADQFGHSLRVSNFEKAMEKIYNDYPDDIEAGIFYALALDAAADLSDKTYANQRKAFEILKPLFEKQPLHPGIAHYIIHNCDNPALGELALPAARKYASIAPASAHAQHMPSHIFTRLGLWDECIQSNLISVSSAQCYAEKAKIKGHWDEELHGMDYLVYAYLQKGDDKSAKQQVDYLESFNEVYPVNFKTAYAFAAIPARYALEKKNWKQAAALKIHPQNFPWKNYPWQEAIFHFARLLGNVHLNQLDSAQKELSILKSLYDALNNQQNKEMEAAQVAVQIKASEAWINFKQGNNEKALQLMQAAADMEDKMEKHPVTPGPVLPSRELLGELLLEMNKPSLAFEVFQENLRLHPYRLNGLNGLSLAARRSGKKVEAKRPG